MLKSLNFKSFDLGTFINKIFVRLAKAIGSCTQLEILDLSDTRLQYANITGFKELGKNLSKLYRLRKLTLSANLIDFSKMTRTEKLKIEAFIEMLSECHTLEELDLSNILLNNKMHTYYGKKLGTALAKMCELKILNLNSNNFGKSPLALQAILSPCKTITTLYLEDNNFPKIYKEGKHEDSETDYSIPKFAILCDALSQFKTLCRLYLSENNFSYLCSKTFETLYQAFTNSPLLEIGGIEEFPKKQKVQLENMLADNQKGTALQAALVPTFAIDL